MLHMNTPIRMSAIVLFNQQRVRDRQKREQLTEAFRRADKNGDGRLSVDEIHGIYKKHGVEVTREEVQKIVDAADKGAVHVLNLLANRVCQQSFSTVFLLRVINRIINGVFNRVIYMVPNRISNRVPQQNKHMNVFIDGTGLLTEKEFVNSQAVGEVSVF